MAWKYFDEKCDPLIVGLNPELMAMLDKARERSGVPFIITSGKRSPDENASLSGSAKDSAHLSGLAVDLSCPTDGRLFAMLLGLIMAGFRRFGVYVAQCSDNPSKFIPRHIHVDIDTTKPLDTVWIQLERN